MPVPWIQIVALMPTILDVSKELLKRSRRTPPGIEAPARPALAGESALAVLEARVAALEENERRQAELVNDIADQLAKLTAAATVLHKQVRRLLVGQVTAIVVALVALLMALR